MRKTEDPRMLPEDEQSTIDRLLKARIIAVVGLSDDPGRISHRIARYLSSAGKRVIAVNPTIRSWQGEPAFPDLNSVPERVELVNVFRRSQFSPDVVRQAIEIRAGGVWLQSGIVSAEARRIAEEAGMDFVQDRCIMIEHAARSRG